MDQEGFSLESSIHCLFYADDGNLVGFASDKVQGSLDLLVDLVASFGLKVNVSKTKTMVTCGPRRHLCQSMTGYKRRRDKSLPSYHERKLSKVICSRCGKSMNAQYLPVHLRSVHDLSRLQIAAAFPLPDETQGSTDPQVYEISYPHNGYPVSCPVQDCVATCSNCSQLYSHFAWRHPRDHLRIQERATLQECPRCGKQLWQVTAKHLASNACAQLSSHHQGILREAAKIEARKVSFTVSSHSLSSVDQFRYLGRILADDDSDSPAIMANLKKARDCWARIHLLLRREGASLKYMTRFYLAIVQAKLLYGSETWVPSKRDLNRLERFHARCARSLANQPIRLLNDGTWVHPHTDRILETCHLSPISTYIAMRKSNFQQQARSTSLVLPRCLELPIATSADRHIWWRGLV
jgi:hypothetical protein